ncbi:MAG: hypothetical protein ACU843_16615, partial [Gammaproteobacteria bacterium]
NGLKPAIGSSTAGSSLACRDFLVLRFWRIFGRDDAHQKRLFRTIRNVLKAPIDVNQDRTTESYSRLK